MIVSQSSPSKVQVASQELADAQISDMLQRVVVDEYSHALEEHPLEAPLVWDCLNKNGPNMQFVIWPKQRYLQVCTIDDETIGFRIVDIVDKQAKELTAYIKDNCKCMKDVIKYANRKGYSRFTGTLQ